MPLAGRMRQRHAHIDEGLQRDDDREPRAASCAKGSRALRRAQQQPDRHDAEQERDQRRRARMPNSSPATAKMKSECASGRRYLIVPAPGPDAGDAAGLERLQREPGLIAGAARIEELRDALAHMGMEQIGEHRERRAARAQRAHPVIGRPAKNSIAAHSGQAAAVWPTSGCSSRMTIAGASSTKRDELARETRASACRRGRPRRARRRRASGIPTAAASSPPKSIQRCAPITSAPTNSTSQAPISASAKTPPPRRCASLRSRAARRRPGCTTAVAAKANCFSA